MGSHKVILKRVTLQSDLRGVVMAVATIRQVKPREAAEMVKNCPFTLVDHCSTPQAMTLRQIFEELHTEILVEPLPTLESTDTAGAMSAGLQQKKQLFRSWSALVVILAILALTGGSLFVGGRGVIAYLRKATDADLVRGMMKAHSGKIFDARDALKSGISEDPRNANLLIQKAVVYLGIARKRMNAEGWASFGGVGNVPQDGQDLFPVPEADTAVKVLFQARDLAPGNPQVYRWLGEVYMQKGLLPEAKAFAEKAVALQDTNIELQNLLGSICLQMGDIGRAETIFRRAVRSNPDYIATYRNLGVLLLFNKKDSAQGLEWIWQYLMREEGKDVDRYTLRKDAVAVAFALANPGWENLLPMTLSFTQYEERRQQLVELLKKGRSAALEEEMAGLFLAHGMDAAAQEILEKLVRNGGASSTGLKWLICLNVRQQSWDVVFFTLTVAHDRGDQDPFFANNLSLLRKYYKLQNIK